MAYKQYRIEDNGLVLGYAFEKMTELLKIACRITAFSGDQSVGFIINGFPLGSSFHADEDFFQLERGICCYKSVRAKSRGLRPEVRWQLVACYKKATSDRFDEEYEFTLTDRNYKPRGKEVCKLSVHSIMLRDSFGDQAIEEGPVVNAVRALDHLLGDIQRSTSNLAEWGASPYGMVVRCTKCSHTRRLEPAKIVSVFRDFVSVQEVASKLRCSWCGHKGQVETIPVLGASLDRRLRSSRTWPDE